MQRPRHSGIGPQELSLRAPDAAQGNKSMPSRIPLPGYPVCYDARAEEGFLERYETRRNLLQ